MSVNWEVTLEVADNDRIYFLLDFVFACNFLAKSFISIFPISSEDKTSI